MSASTLLPEPKINETAEINKRRNPSREIGAEPTPKGKERDRAEKGTVCVANLPLKKKSKKRKIPLTKPAPVERKNS